MIFVLYKQKENNDRRRSGRKRKNLPEEQWTLDKKVSVFI